MIEAMQGSPREAAKEHRRQGPPPRHQAKPYRKPHGGPRR